MQNDLAIYLCRLYDKHVKFFRALSLTLFIFGLLGWLYIAAVALVHPKTLPMQLTHFALWPKEDEFGEFSFAVSFVSFFIWNLVKDNK
jgi:hypothetical protein